MEVVLGPLALAATAVTWSLLLLEKYRIEIVSVWQESSIVKVSLHCMHTITEREREYLSDFYTGDNEILIDKERKRH